VVSGGEGGFLEDQDKTGPERVLKGAERINPSHWLGGGPLKKNRRIREVNAGEKVKTI